MRRPVIRSIAVIFAVVACATLIDGCGGSKTTVKKYDPTNPMANQRPGAPSDNAANKAAPTSP